MSMTNKEIIAVVQAAEEGKVIKRITNGPVVVGVWLIKKKDEVWRFDLFDYRVASNQPKKMVERVYTCWETREGHLSWSRPLASVPPQWNRIPTLDKKVMVEE